MFLLKISLSLLFSFVFSGETFEFMIKFNDKATRKDTEVNQTKRTTKDDKYGELCNDNAIRSHIILNTEKICRSLHERQLFFVDYYPESSDMICCNSKYLEDCKSNQRKDCPTLAVLSNDYADVCSDIKWACGNIAPCEYNMIKNQSHYDREWLRIRQSGERNQSHYDREWSRLREIDEKCRKLLINWRANKGTLEECCYYWQFEKCFKNNVYETYKCQPKLSVEFDETKCKIKKDTCPEFHITSASLSLYGTNGLVISVILLIAILNY